VKSAHGKGIVISQIENVETGFFEGDLCGHGSGTACILQTTRWT
jgi:hypothetical protein